MFNSARLSPRLYTTKIIRVFCEKVTFSETYFIYSPTPPLSASTDIRACQLGEFHRIRCKYILL